MPGRSIGQRALPALTMALAAICGVGSLMLFTLFLAGRLYVQAVRGPEIAVLFWDAGLSLAFFAQHSGMVRRGFRARLSRVFPARYHGALYSIASGVVLTAVVCLWIPTGHTILLVHGVFRSILRGVTVVALAFFCWGVFSLPSVDLCGLAPIRAYLHGAAERAPHFAVRGAYGWVRHPLYIATIALIWAHPEITSDRLLFNVLWTAWIWSGARWEEADLSKEFGEAYRHYQRSVPMLVPWRGRAKS